MEEKGYGSSRQHKQYDKDQNIKITMLINTGIMQRGKLLVPVS
jgi:hypothetical protein